jgi:ubiquinone/menaquinone biosynthesis C-methylase UbiE
MIEHARMLQQTKGLTNVSWQVGDVRPLPYADALFSIVASRYAFHHFLDPGAVLAEMKRVCTPGGKVAVIDVTASPDPTKAAAYNRMEKLRDPLACARPHAGRARSPLREARCVFRSSQEILSSRI